MPRPVAVTIDVNDDIFFWADFEKGLAFVKLVGGKIEAIPDEVDEDEDEDE